MKTRHLLLLVIIFIGIFLRFYRLKDFPVQLNHDEITQLYDAISIAQTGKDIYGNFLPFIFPSVGDFKPPFYTYITSIFYIVFGSGEVTIRLPAVLFGLLMIPAVYFFTLKLLKNNRIALLAALLTSIAPFELFFSRKSFESGAGIFLMLLGFSYLLFYVEVKSKPKLLFLAAASFGIAIYTYFSHAIIIPLLLVVFGLIYRKSLIENFKQIRWPLTLLLCFILPILILTITNSDTRYRSQTVFITQDINLGKNIEYSKQKNSLLAFLTRNKAILDFSFNRYLEQFDVRYIFGNGLEFTNQGPLDMGPLFLIQLPFLILGGIYLVKLKAFNKEKKFILAWILVGMLPSGLTFETHSPHRSIMVFTMFDIISAVGLYMFLKIINGINSQYNFMKRFILSFLILVFIINIVYFTHMYFVNFPFEKSQSIHYPYKEVSLFAWSQYSKFAHIIVDPIYGQSAPVGAVGVHYYLAYYGQYLPSKFQNDLKIEQSGTSFDKFTIRQIDWRKDQFLKSTLIIASPWSIPIADIDKSKIIKIFHFYDGQPAFYAVKLN